MEPTLGDMAMSLHPETWSGSHTPADLYHSLAEAFCGATESDTDPRGDPQPLATQEQDVNPAHQGCRATVDAQMSLSDFSLDQPTSASESHDHGILHSDAQTLLRSRDVPSSNSGESDTESPTATHDLHQNHGVQGQAGCDLLDTSSSLRGVMTPPPAWKHPGSGSLDSAEEEERGGVERGEGGCEKGPPSCSPCGIWEQGAEAAEDWGAASQRDFIRPSRNRARQARLRRSEGQTEKQLHEAKSKCKRIALLFTAAPNPASKGVLMFNKCRQRVKKYTLVSYGTGKTELTNAEDEDEFEDNNNRRFPLSATSESECEEYPFDAFAQTAPLNFDFAWDTKQGGLQTEFDRIDMEHLPKTRGKGALMFAQRRQRMDEIAAEHEEMRRKGIPVEAFEEPEQVYDDTSFLPEDSSPNEAYMDDCVKEQLNYQEQQEYQQEMFQQPTSDMNGFDRPQSPSMPKGLVPNRTAKPFSSGTNRAPAPFSSVKGITSPTPKRPENIFRVPVPVNTSPQVWSPTGDIIASRDERIAVPAIKTGNLPDSKRRGSHKGTVSKASPKGDVNHDLQDTVDQRSFGESCPEEDYLSLGAEACNFMQPPTIKLKNPPPVAPKPAINPACPPWSREGQARVAGSPIPASSPTPAIAPAQIQSAPQQSWVPPQPAPRPRDPPQPAPRPRDPPQPAPRPRDPPQPAPKPWAPAQTQALPQHPMTSWSPTKQAVPYQPARTPDHQQSAPVSTQTPHASQVAVPQPQLPWIKKQTSVNSVSSCPPQQGRSYLHASRAPPTSPMGPALDTGMYPPSAGPNLKGRGAQLFAKRQSRMEKFVVDTETVQANKARSPSPSHSMPSTWRYSPNVRAPPPASYNPILAPFYPPAALKQTPSTSPKIKPKTPKEKPKPVPKHLNVLDVMKHQPYQLNTTLFTYNSTSEVKDADSKTSPVPPSQTKQSPSQTPSNWQAPSPTYGPSPIHPPSPIPPTGTAPPAQPGKPFSPDKPSAPALGRSRSLSLPRRLSSMSSQPPLSPVSTPGSHSCRSPLERQGSWLDQPHKPPSPWEAASRSPFGQVDEAFALQNIQQSVAANVPSAIHRKSFPGPPLQLKRRVSFEACAYPGPKALSPAVTSPSKALLSPSPKPAVCGPPFRPAQPLRTSSGLSGHVSLPRDATSHFNYTQPKVSWRV